MPEKEQDKKAHGDELNGLLAEYKTLRDEILAGQARRLQTVQLTYGAFGAILSIIAGAVLGTGIPANLHLAVAVGGGIALYGILIPGQIMATHLQQTIQRIGGYIRVFIEPRVPGLNWENAWDLRKSKLRLPKGLGGISDIFYFLCALPFLLPLYIVISQGNGNGYLVLGLVPFLLWSLWLSIDMKFGFSAGWKPKWEPDVQVLSPGKPATRRVSPVSSGEEEKS